MVKTWLCTNCKRKRITEESTIMYQCGCGYPMEEVNQNEYIEIKIQEVKT